MRQQDFQTYATFLRAPEAAGSGRVLHDTEEEEATASLDIVAAACGRMAALGPAGVTEEVSATGTAGLSVLAARLRATWIVHAAAYKEAFPDAAALVREEEKRARGR